MKLRRVFTALVALAFVIGGAIAATTGSNKTAVAETLDLEYFELVQNGNPLDVEDWVISETDPECPTTVSATPCRIRAYASGSHPEEMEFEDIKDLSSDFTTAYTAKVTYKP